MGSFGVVRFTRVHPWFRCVHPGSLGTLVLAQGVVWFIWVRIGVRWFHPGSLGSVGCAQGVVEFTRGCWIPLGAPWGSMSSSAWLRSLVCALRDFGFNQGGRVHSGVP